MGFWGSLAKIGSAVTGFLPIPGAGVISKALGTAGNVLGSAAAGAGQAQGQAANLALQQGGLDLSRWNALNNQNLQSAEMGLKAPGAYGRQSFMGDLLANPKAGPAIQQNPRANMVTFGGFSPSDLSDSTRELGGLMQANALKGMKAGNPYVPTAMPAAPEMPGQSFWQKVGTTLGPPLSLAGALMGGGPQEQDYGGAASQIGTNWEGPQMPGGYDPFTPDADPFNLSPQKRGGSIFPVR